MAYNRVTEPVAAALRAIVGDKHVVTDPDRLQVYSHDELTDRRFHYPPEAAVFPGAASEVAAIVSLANRELIPVVPRGAGTGLAGGAVPLRGGIVIGLERMNRIIEINAAGRYMIVEPGVRTEDVQQAAQKAGLFYAGDPCSGDSCFIGGNVATNAGGNRAVKYGVTGDQVYALEVVTPTGRIATLGGRLEKSSTGYGLEQLIIGSEGTLGIVTRITLRLLPLPAHCLDLLAIFPDVEQAAGAVAAILSRGLEPACLELIDNSTVKCIERFLGEPQPDSGRGNYLIIQLDGEDRDQLDDKAALVDELCAGSGALSVLVAGSQKIWRVRKAFAEAVRHESLIMSKEDLVVPLDCIPPVIREIARLSGRYKLITRLAAHAGDGNIHLNILKGDMPEALWDEKLDGFQRALYAGVYELGGKLSGEHGIGFKRKQLLRQYCDPVELDMMRAVKKALDPNNILNPGKIFDLE